VRHILWSSCGTLDRTPVSLETASSYWNALIATFKDDAARPVEAIASALASFGQGAMNHAELMHVVAVHLAGHDRLLLAFDMFLPPHLSMTNLLVLQKTAVLAACAVDRTLESDERRMRYIARSVTEEAGLVVSAGFHQALPSVPPSWPHGHDDEAVSLETLNAWVDQAGAALGKESKQYLCLMTSLIALGSATQAQSRQALAQNVRECLKDHAELASMFEVIVKAATSVNA